MNKAKTTLFYMCVKAGSQLGLPGSIGFRRVNSTSGFYLDPDRFHARDGQVLDRPAGSTGFRRAKFPAGFYLDLARSRPGSARSRATRRVGSGFKTMAKYFECW